MMFYLSCMEHGRTLGMRESHLIEKIDLLENKKDIYCIANKTQRQDVSVLTF